MGPARCVDGNSNPDSSALSEMSPDNKRQHHEQRDCELDGLEMKKHVLEGLRKGFDAKEVSPRFLYDKRGSELYESITKLEEYYLYKAEDDLLDEHVQEIVAQIPSGSVVVELGCGSATKTAKLLNSVIAQHGRCQFVGIDVSQSFLDDAKCNLMLQVNGQLSVEMVQSDYLKGLRYVRDKYPDALLCLLWLGSSVGNFDAESAVTFLKDVLTAVDFRCRILLCTDMWKKAATLYAAYHDRQGVTEQFIKNGMKNALRIIGCGLTSQEQQEKSWAYEVEIDKDRHQFLTVLVNLLEKREGEALSTIESVPDRPGERILMEISRKFTIEDIYFLAQNAGFQVTSAWRNEKYGCQMLLSQYEALQQCWQITDSVFQGLPDWTVQPIDVRRHFGFYYGHLSSFTKIKIFENEPPSSYDVMFARGIDPIVLDPSRCHSHPDAPAVWPEPDEVVSYVQSIRERLLGCVREGMMSEGEGARKITMILEHEYMHLETLTYMIAQERKAAFEKYMAKRGRLQQILTNASKTKEPPTTETLKRSLSKLEMITIESGPVVLGVEPSESVFLWDNEYPQVHKDVNSFLVSSSPVSIGQFYRFVLEGGYENKSFWKSEDFEHFKKKGIKFPSTWSCIEGDIYVHEYQATKHWLSVADQPVYVSLSEAEAFCMWVGGGTRVMTEAEYRRVLDVDKHEMVVRNLRSGGWEWTSSALEPFPGFKAMPEYPEYSTDFFDGQHFVLKGSSPVTHPSMLRDSFRNFYQKQYPYVFAKFRCCNS